MKRRTRVVQFEIGVRRKDGGQEADGAFVSLPVRHLENRVEVVLLYNIC